jgi:hypothetical protein
MSQVLLHLPFRNTEHPSQLIGGHPSIGQEINHALTQGPFRKQHGNMVSTQLRKSQITGACSFRNHMKCEVLNGCTAASILSESNPASFITSPINQVGRGCRSLSGTIAFRLSVQ